MEGLLQNVWYIIIGVALVAYVVLDGFDLGVGMLHPFARGDYERRVFLNSIGPVWDGNAIWLVIVGGGLFAGFPGVYATLFSGFYDLVMVFLCSLIFRAVAIEFRSKRPSVVWRSTWDYVFAIASLGIAFGAGVVLGNFIEGIPLDGEKNFTGSLFSFFTPYAILIGCLSVSLLMMHGSIYLVMKTEGDLQKKLQRWGMHTISLFFLFYFLSTCATLLYMPHMTDRYKELPWTFFLPALAFICFFMIPKLFFLHKVGLAFLFSCFGITLLVSLFGIGTYPYLVRSSIDSIHNSWTIENAASSRLTLQVLLTIVAIGVPLVIGYGCYIYKVFRGKVRIGPSSY